VETDSMLVVEQHVSQCANDKIEVATTLNNLDAVAEQIGSQSTAHRQTGTVVNPMHRSVSGAKSFRILPPA